MAWATLVALSLASSDSRTVTPDLRTVRIALRGRTTRNLADWPANFARLTMIGSTPLPLRPGVIATRQTRLLSGADARHENCRVRVPRSRGLVPNTIDSGGDPGVGLVPGTVLPTSARPQDPGPAWA